MIKYYGLLPGLEFEPVIFQSLTQSANRLSYLDPHGRRAVEIGGRWTVNEWALISLISTTDRQMTTANDKDNPVDIHEDICLTKRVIQVNHIDKLII
jgi:hypothetical protein